MFARILLVLIMLLCSKMGVAAVTQEEAMDACMAPYEVASDKLLLGFTIDKEEVLLEGIQKCKKVTSGDIVVEKVVLDEMQINTTIIGTNIIVLVMVVSLCVFSVKKREKLLSSKSSELANLREETNVANKNADNLKSQNARLVAENKATLSTLNVTLEKLEGVKAELAAQSPQSWEEWKQNLEKGRKFYAELGELFLAMRNSVAFTSQSSSLSRPNGTSADD